MTIEHNGITYELLELVEPNKKETSDILGIFKLTYVEGVPTYELITYFWGVPREDEDIKKMALEELAKIDYYVVRIETRLNDDDADTTQEFPTLKETSDFIDKLMTDKSFLLETVGDIDPETEIILDIAHSTQDDFIVLADCSESFYFKDMK